MDAAAPLSPREDRRQVLALALPAIASGLVLIAYHWVNQAWVGRLPDATTAAAALGVASFAVWAYQSVTYLVATGVAAVVGRYAGAGRLDAARFVAAHGLRWSAALAAACALAGWALAPYVFELAGVSDAAAREGTRYVRILWVAGFAAMAQAVCDAIWRGHGSTRVPLATSALGLGVNAVLDPLLIFGWGPVPGSGVAGAAIATVLASTLALAVSLGLLRRAGLLSRVRPADAVLRLDDGTPLAPGPWPALDLSVGRRLARIGLPACANGLFFVAIYLLLSRIVTRAGGDAAQAGLGVGLRGEQVAFVLGNGFAAAAAVLTARRLGAGRPDEAARAAWRASAMASAASFAWGLLLFVGADALARLFLPDGHASAEARAHAADFWRIVAPCLAFQAFEIVLDGAFSGAGMTVPPMVVTMVLTAARVPLAEHAAFGAGWGVRGIWIVIAVTAALRGLLTAAWFSRGTWKRRSV